MGFIRRALFYYFLRRSRYNPLYLPPVPNQVYAEPGPVPGSPQQITYKHGSRWEAFKYHTRIARWEVEHWIDEKMGFPGKRIEWLSLRTLVQVIEKDRGNVGNSRKR